MTKFLSTLLGAQEPSFRFTLRQLESAAGAPSADIRLSTDIAARTRSAIAELGLDPKDTTPEELYVALQRKVAQSELAVLRHLKISAAVGNQEVLQSVQKFAASLTKGTEVLSLKASVAKRLVKSNPPTKTMKQLGYRSVDSLLKHESPAALCAAAKLCEDDAWHTARAAQYSALRSTDFEVARLQFVAPKTKKWEKLAFNQVLAAKHNVAAFPEFGTVVLLPLPESYRVRGLSLLTLLLVLQASNEITAASSYLKLHQVHRDFGSIVADLANGTSFVAANVASQPITWKLIHRYFSEIATFPAHIFEPHVQHEDMVWRHVEQLLATHIPDLAFWQKTSFAATMQDGVAVSMNVYDAALSYCNRLSCRSQALVHVRENIWHELTTRYLRQENVERTVTEQLGRTLAPEPALI